MMRRLLPLILLGLASGCARTGAEQAQEAFAPPPPPSPAPSATIVTGSRVERPACPLVITFASYGAGIDNPTRERVQALLVSDRRVAGFETSRWGREGEVTLCVRTRAPADAASLFNRVRGMLPPRPRGPISLSTRAGLTYSSPAPLR
jgi:hypothetical protein